MKNNKQSIRHNNENNEYPKFSFNPLRIGIHAVSLFPLFELAYQAYAKQLTVNPIQYVEQFLGRAALNLLILALAVTPLITLTGWKTSPGFRAVRIFLFCVAFYYFCSC